MINNFQYKHYIIIYYNFTKKVKQQFKQLIQLLIFKFGVYE